MTDAAGETLPETGVGAPVIVERVGATDANQAIAALSALRRAGGAQLDLFVAVSNPSAAEAVRRLEVYADGELVDARELRIPPGQRSEALISTVPPAARIVEARLAGTDALATDDRAFAIVPPEATVRALLVGDANPYLENALALLPRLGGRRLDALDVEDGGERVVRRVHLALLRLASRSEDGERVWREVITYEVLARTQTTPPLS